MFKVSCQNIENFSRNSYFQVGGLHARVRVLILVCATRNEDARSNIIRFERLLIDLS